MSSRNKSIGNKTIGAVAALALCVPLMFAGTAFAAPVAATAKAPVAHTVIVGSNPYDVAISQSLGRAFVVNDGSVSVVSLLTHRQLAEFGTGGWHNQNAIALMRTNTQGYITNNALNTVTVFDTETDKVSGHITVGYGAVDVVKANTTHGQRAYVVTSVDAAPEHSGARNEVVAIQTSTGKVVGRTKLPGESTTLAVAPGAKSVWVGNTVDGHVYQISTATAKVARTVKPTKAGPVNAIAFAPGGKKVWVAGLGGVSVLDAKSGKLIKYVTAAKLGTGWVVPAYLALNTSGTYAFVVNSAFGSDERGSVSAINTKTYQVAWTVKLGNVPLGIGLDKTRGVAYVPNYDDDTVSYFSVPK